MSLLASGRQVHHVAQRAGISSQEAILIGAAHGMTYGGGRMTAPVADAPSLVDQPAWHRLALCVQTDPDAFFSDDPGDVRAAQKVCRGCPARVQCLSYARENGEQHGVWGGEFFGQPREVRREHAA